MSKFFTNRKKQLAAAFAAAGSALVSSGAMADAAAVQAAITAAQTEGTASVELVVIGLITLTAVVVGVGIIIAMLKKG